MRDCEHRRTVGERSFNCHHATQEVRTPLGRQGRIGREHLVQTANVHLFDIVHERAIAKRYLAARRLYGVDGVHALHAHGQFDVDAVAARPVARDHRVPVLDPRARDDTVHLYGHESIGLGRRGVECAHFTMGHAHVYTESRAGLGVHGNCDGAVPGVVRFLHHFDIRAGNVLYHNRAAHKQIDVDRVRTFGVHPRWHRQQRARDVADAARDAVPRGPQGPRVEWVRIVVGLAVHRQTAEEGVVHSVFEQVEVGRVVIRQPELPIKEDLAAAGARFAIGVLP